MRQLCGGKLSGQHRCLKLLELLDRELLCCGGVKRMRQLLRWNLPGQPGGDRLYGLPQWSI